MGKVWRAHHTALKRDDALKVLPEAFASDPERLARFQREAQVLASLNHPNIAHVYGLEESDGTKALVMELVEGPTLADRIAEGRIPVDEALAVAKQIAEALEAAHEQGIIHRDLKPANIKLRPDGTVKVLDFGLAKALEPASGMRADVTASPTITTPAMTGIGMILGTAAYMSPEQAKGRPADKRSDIWAFGCVLYEMLAGKRAFDGEDVSDTLAAVLRGEPDEDRIPADVPVLIRSLINGCLKKDRNQRIGDISTAIFLLRQAPGDRALGSTMQLRPRPLWRRAIPLVAAGIVGSLLTGAVLQTSRHALPVPLTVARFPIPLPENLNFPASGLRLVAISPDGTKVVDQANEPRPEGPIGGLYLRSISDTTVRPIPGTEQSIGEPVFSPDGQSLVFFIGNRGVRVAYFSKGVLRRIALACASRGSGDHAL
jgi:eukaryotic-like serine/threonine-protein kinase